MKTEGARVLMVHFFSFLIVCFLLFILFYSYYILAIATSIYLVNQGPTKNLRSKGLGGTAVGGVLALQLTDLCLNSRALM